MNKEKIGLVHMSFLIFSCSNNPIKSKTNFSNYPKMNSQNVRYIISSNLQNFKGCYDREGEDKRQFVTLEFLVDPKGNVRRPEVSANTKLRKLEDCIKIILSGLTFEKMPHSKEFRYAKQTLTFVPSFRGEN